MESPGVSPSTYERILQGALEHFSRYGYSGASVRNISKASKVTKPTLYYYFKNKENLYVELAKKSGEEVFSSLKKASDTGVNSYERLTNLVRAYFNFSADRSALIKFLHLTALFEGEEDVPAIKSSFLLEINHLLNEILDEGVRKGEFAAEDKDSICYALHSMCHFSIVVCLSKSRVLASLPWIETSLKKILGITAEASVYR